MAEGFRIRVMLPALIGGLAVMAGCLSAVVGDPPAYNLPEPPVTVPVVKLFPQPVAEMALSPEDLPPAFSLKERSIIPAEETDQLTRDLGWMRGYRVVYIRMNYERNDITGIRQVIGIYPPDAIQRVFALEKETLLHPSDSTVRYEIAFPRVGNNSVAVWMTDPGDAQRQTVYSVLFYKNNILEQITMGGTATDYELLRSLAMHAAEKIR